VLAPKLVAIGGPLDGATFPLDEAEIAIGRDDTNGVSLPDPSVSPRHCVLTCDGQQVTIRDLDRSNPSFVNGLPAGERTVEHGDRIQIGRSVLVLLLDDVAAADPVRVDEDPAPERPAIVMRLEDALVGSPAMENAPAARLARELTGLMRISAAINAVRGLVALQRPLIELIADVVPASRGALILSGERRTEIASAVGWDRKAGAERTVHVSRPVIERVLREAVGVLSESPEGSGMPGAAGPRTARSVLAAPLVAFDRLLGAIYLELDQPGDRFDEGHLKLMMSIGAVAATALEYGRHVEWLAEENRRLQAELDVDHNMVGESAVMQDVYWRIGRVAQTDSTVLITGESGTGKELAARAIHRNSPRGDRPCVAINCAAITESLLESELFGHEKGAFTGAVSQKKGKLEAAEGGTVFLDEVGELSPALQAKLLRVLQEREFERVGGTRPISVDFRLVASTNRDLAEAIAGGTFRRDLYYRLNVVSLAMPPLRDRPEDIPLLASYFARRHGDKVKRRVSGVSTEALACLIAYDWPGNVRELENAIERAVVLGSTELILPEDLPDAMVEAGPTAGSAGAAGASGLARFHDAIKQAKKDLIVKVVEEAGGNYNRAARVLGLHPNSLHRLIRNLRLKAALKKSS
jgi:transcriptional regulator with GAF, ATPase, and Fis domain